MKATKTPTVKTPTAKPAPAKKAAKPAERYSVELGEYNGNPTLQITDTQARNPKYSSFTFGAGKARGIVACIEQIKEFVADNPEKSAK